MVVRRPDFGRAFHAGRHAAGSLGEREEFSTEGRKATAPPDDLGNPTMDLRGDKRSKTHATKTDPDVQLARKSYGKEAKLSYSGNLLVENRNGLILGVEVFGPTRRRSAMRRW